MFIWLRLLLVWWAGELVCGFRSLFGDEETPPTRRIALPLGEKARALATEQKRHVHLGLGDDSCVMSSAPWWNGETAVLQVERANRR